MGGRTGSVGQKLLTDFEFFAPRVLRIRAKDGAIIPFALNRAQHYLHNRIEEQRQKTGRVRAIGLKGRQQGFSTYVQGRYFWRLLPSRGQRAFILTHEQEATNNLFEIAERFCSEAPFAVEPDKSNAKELHFTDQDSGYKVGTAGNKAVGRSSTIQLFHGSEVAHWPNADAHKAGVIQAVPDLPGTEIILESTANGVGGMFHELWIEANEGRNEYLTIFIPWFWQDEYRKDIPPGFKRSTEEQKLVKIYGLDDRQLAWRRAKIGELRPSEGGNPEDLFKQEYPCTPEEAFLFSGRLVFAAGLLQSALLECWKPKYRAEVALSTGRFEKADQGRLSVWEEPNPGERYVIGADVAEGLEHGDYSCADILAVSNGRQIAQWRGHIDPDQYGLVLKWLGKAFSNALVGVERNNHGLTTLKTLQDAGYPNLYIQEDLEHRADGKETKKVGWLTTSKSKNKIIDQLAAELRDGNHNIRSAETIKEMATFVLDETGKMGAKPGCFDDRVMSRAIAGEMVLSAPRTNGNIAPHEPYRPAQKKVGY